MKHDSVVPSVDEAQRLFLKANEAVSSACRALDLASGNDAVDRAEAEYNAALDRLTEAASTLAAAKRLHSI